VTLIGSTPGMLTCHGTDKRIGATVGGGIEYGFTPNWSAKVEYRYTMAPHWKRHRSIRCSPASIIGLA